ncbi:MAG TPA: GAF domain-containing protein [Ktedonobacteraceae bacterium]|nr:GAF domain-containing protein [Ktedonobacteraceae bacterium]
MPEPHHYVWRTIVGQIASNTSAREQLATQLGVNPVTLLRWSGIHKTGPVGEQQRVIEPRKGSLLKLVFALPEHREALIASLTEEFPSMFKPEDFQLDIRPSFESTTIPAICYEAVLQATATLSGGMRYTSVFDHLLRFALLQLDPERLGLSAIVVQCTPPASGEKVRSLREHFRVGTPPWQPGREERNLFLGAESLAGKAVETRRPYEVEDIRSYTGLLPIHRTKYEVSAAVCPILRTGAVAGCLLFSSTQPDFFTRERVKLIEKYAHLALEAFDPQDFYPPERIELRWMPTAEEQEPMIRLIPKQVMDLLRTGQITNRTLAEHEVIHRTEENLIYLASLASASDPCNKEIALERS